MNAIKQIKKKLESIPPEKKATVGKLILIGGCFLLVLLLYFFIFSGGSVKRKPKMIGKELDVQTTILGRTFYRELKKDLRDTRSRIAVLQDRLSKIEAILEELKKKKHLPERIEARPETEAPSKPQVPPSGPSAPMYAPQPSRIPPAPTPYWEEPKQQKATRAYKIGGIQIFNAPQKPKEKKKEKKEENVIYLPSGTWAEGLLLTGFHAPTELAGKKAPPVILIKLLDLAVLPNDLQTDLEGCYVLAEVRGDLSSGRAIPRVYRLSCLAYDGSALIDEEVYGEVIDSDGKVDLAGHTVLKAGPLFWRYFLAGALEGVAQGIEESTYSLSSSPLGAVYAPEVSAKDIAKRSLGRGFSESTKKLSELYLDLIKKTPPMIEVGALKNVTVVFTKGKLLKIRHQKPIHKEFVGGGKSWSKLLAWQPY